MRILIFVENFSPRTQTFIYNEVNGLLANHDVLVVCHSRVLKEEFPFKNVHILDWRITKVEEKFKGQLSKYGLPFSYYNKSRSSNLSQILLDFKPDIIHCNFGDHAIRWVENLITTKPIFITFRGYDASYLIDQFRGYRNKLAELFKKKNIHPIFVCEALHEHVVSNIGQKTDQKRILYSGINIQKFKRISKNNTSGKKIFLQISSFREKKGHYYTIKAFNNFYAQLEDEFKSKVSMILAGDGPKLLEMKSLVKDLHLQEVIQFPGSVSHHQAKELLEKANYFIHPSITTKYGNKEGIPNAVMEAMAMELPILSTIHSGIPELVEDSINGYLVEEKDTETMAKRMRDILDWSYLTINREKIKTQFEFKKHMTTLEGFYTQVISNV